MSWWGERCLKVNKPLHHFLHTDVTTIFVIWALSDPFHPPSHLFQVDKDHNPLKWLLTIESSLIVVAQPRPSVAPGAELRSVRVPLLISDKPAYIRQRQEIAGCPRPAIDFHPVYRIHQIEFHAVRIIFHFSSMVRRG